MEKVVEKRKGKLHVGTLTKGINTYEYIVKEEKGRKVVTIEVVVGIVDMEKTKNVLPDLVKHAEFNLLII